MHAEPRHAHDRQTLFTYTTASSRRRIIRMRPSARLRRFPRRSGRLVTRRSEPENGTMASACSPEASARARTSFSAACPIIFRFPWRISIRPASTHGRNATSARSSQAICSATRLSSSCGTTKTISRFSCTWPTPRRTTAHGAERVRRHVQAGRHHAAQELPSRHPFDNGEMEVRMKRSLPGRGHRRWCASTSPRITE